jgi:hypothetical protein
VGHFGYVVGVDRLGRAAELRRHGADVVVTDLAALLEPDAPEAPRDLGWEASVQRTPGLWREEAPGSP